MLKAIGSSAYAPSHSKGEISVDFDFNRIEAPETSNSADETQQKLLKVINAIAEWLYPSRSRSTTMVLRAYAYIWVVRPEWLGNPTQAELARRLHVSKACFGKIVNQFRKQFGFYVAGMRHEDTRTKLADHARRNAGPLAIARRQQAQKLSRIPASTARGNSAGGAR